MFVVLVYYTITFFFFFNDTATTEIYTLSLHDALPISGCCAFGATRHVTPDRSAAADSLPCIAVTIVSRQARAIASVGAHTRIDRPANVSAPSGTVAIHAVQSSHCSARPLRRPRIS